MTEFDYERHRIKGDAGTARSWIESSALPEDDKADLLRFVSRFPSLTFFREDDALLDYYAETDQVVLPEWLREVRSTLAFVDPPSLVRVDDFQWHDSTRCESVELIWYELRQLGYSDEEERDLWRDGARIYSIGGWLGTDRSYLAADLRVPINHPLRSRP